MNCPSFSQGFSGTFKTPALIIVAVWRYRASKQGKIRQCKATWVAGFCSPLSENLSGLAGFELVSSAGIGEHMS